MAAELEFAHRKAAVKAGDDQSRAAVASCGEKLKEADVALLPRPTRMPTRD